MSWTSTRQLSNPKDLTKQARASARLRQSCDLRNTLIFKMDNKEMDLLQQYDAIMDGYEPLTFVSSDWPMENGVYRQYSAFEESV